MTNFSSITIDRAPTPEELDALRKQVDQPRQVAEPQTNAPMNGRVQYYKDGMTVESFGPQAYQAATPLRSGMCRVAGGQTTTVAAAKNGKLAIVEYAPGEEPASFRQAPAQATAAAGGNGSGDDGDDVAKTASDDAAPPEVMAASVILEGVAGKIGADAVNSGLDAVARSGEMPETLPEGMSAGDAERVMGGYIAQANAALGEAGASVEMLQEVCTPEELARARVATLYGDNAQLAAIGNAAVNRLAALPVSDPEAFADLVAGMPAKERECLKQDARGNYVVHHPKLGSMSLATALRMGVAKVGR